MVDSYAPAAALSVEGVYIRYGGMNAVSDVSFAIAPGKRVGLIGPNGAGKTSIINTVAGVVRPAEGRVSLHGTDITRWSAHRRARSGLRRTFQNLEAFGSLTVRETLLVTLEAGGAGWLGGRRGRGRGKRQRIDEMIDLVGLGDLRGPVGELAYGARKLVELARAVVCEPTVLLLDEPAAGLSSVEKEDFIQRVDNLLAAQTTCLLLIEHDMVTVERLCADQVIVLDAGAVIARGRFREVVADERVIKAYLGRAL